MRGELLSGFFMDYRREKEKEKLIKKSGSSSNYLSDLRAAVYGGQGRHSEMVTWYATNTTGGNSSNYDNDVLEKFLRENSITDAKPLSQGKKVYHATTDFA